MRTILFCLLSLAFLAQSFKNSDVSLNPAEAKAADNNSYFADKDWQTIVKINEYYLAGIVKSKMKLESVDELTPENIAQHLNISLEKYNADIQLVKQAGMRLKARMEKDGAGCKDCEISSPDKTSNILKTLQKMRKNQKFMTDFFKSMEGVNLDKNTAEQEPTDCAQPISFLGCVAACSALGPILGSICAAGCWCQFCHPGEC